MKRTHALNRLEKKDTKTVEFVQKMADITRETRLPNHWSLKSQFILHDPRRHPSWDPRTNPVAKLYSDFFQDENRDFLVQQSRALSKEMDLVTPTDPYVITIMMNRAFQELKMGDPDKKRTISALNRRTIQMMQEYEETERKRNVSYFNLTVKPAAHGSVTFFGRDALQERPTYHGGIATLDREIKLRPDIPNFATTSSRPTVHRMQGILVNDQVEQERDREFKEGLKHDRPTEFV